MHLAASCYILDRSSCQGLNDRCFNISYQCQNLNSLLQMLCSQCYLLVATFQIILNARGLMLDALCQRISLNLDSPHQMLCSHCQVLGATFLIILHARAYCQMLYVSISVLEPRFSSLDAMLSMLAPSCYILDHSSCQGLNVRCFMLAYHCYNLDSPHQMLCSHCQLLAATFFIILHARG